MPDIRVALIGCGNMGKGLITQLATIDGAELVAGVDPFEEARKAFSEEREVPTYETFDRALEGSEIDAVIVANPNDGHAPATIAAAKTGKHVFCEKPMALTVGDCQAMIDACAEAGVKLQIGQVLRYLPDFDKALELIRAGDIGEPKHGMIFRYGPPREAWGGDTWRDDAGRVGHNLFEVSVHEIDFARCVFGKPVAVTGWELSFDPKSPLWSHAVTGIIEFESGAVCNVTEGYFNAFGRSEVELSGTEGSIRFRWGQSFGYKSFTGKPEIDAEGSEIAEGVEPGVRREVREWIEAIEHDTACTIPGEEGMANIEIVLAILESSKRKERVELPPGV